MPKGPNGQQRPTDSNACAATVVCIATGEIEDRKEAALGRRKNGMARGKVRAVQIGTEERREIAEKAAAARWM